MRPIRDPCSPPYIKPGLARLNWSLFALIILSLMLHSSQALPNGSPLCEVEAEKIGGCMGGDNNAALEYKVDCGDCSVKPGEKLTFKLTAKAEFYKGLLMYVQGATPKDRVGEFQITDKQLKDNEKRCKRFNYQKGSVLTHVNNSNKPSTAEFVWTAPKACPDSLELNAAFIFNRLSNWQVIAPLKITCAKRKSEPYGPESHPPSNGSTQKGSINSIASRKTIKSLLIQSPAITNSTSLRPKMAHNQCRS